MRHCEAHSAEAIPNMRRAKPLYMFHAGDCRVGQSPPRNDVNQRISYIAKNIFCTLEYFTSYIISPVSGLV